MEGRLPTKLWIDALVRRAQTGAASVYIVQSGDEQRGDILVKVARLDGTGQLLRPVTDMDGKRIALDLTAQGTGPDEASIDVYIAKTRNRDPDMWVIEIEDRDGRHFITEPIRTDYTAI